MGATCTRNRWRLIAIMDSIIQMHTRIYLVAVIMMWKVTSMALTHLKQMFRVRQVINVFVKQVQVAIHALQVIFRQAVHRQSV